MNRVSVVEFLTFGSLSYLKMNCAPPNKLHQVSGWHLLSCLKMFAKQMPNSQRIALMTVVAYEVNNLGFQIIGQVVHQ